MYLSRFGVKRYKCLGDIDIPLTPIHVLIGQNDAGKTSLLEAIEAFHLSSKQGLDELFPEPWTGLDLVLQGSTEPIVQLSGEWAPVSFSEDLAAESFSLFKYSFSVRFHHQERDCTLQSESAWLQDRECNIAIRHPKTTLLRQWKDNNESLEKDERYVDSIDFVKPVADLLIPAHKYGLDPKVMSVPAAFQEHRRYRMEFDGFGLSTMLMDILGHDAARFLELRNEFCNLFPQFKSVQIEFTTTALLRAYSDGLANTSGKGTGVAVCFDTRSRRMIRAEQASDGAILMLGFLALAYLPDPPKMLLIEEPENGIYPKRLSELLAMLKRMVKRHKGFRFPQIILTTHSPYVLSLFEPEEVTFLSREPGGPDAPVRARPLRDAPNIKERMGDGEFYLGELWYNLTEEDLFGKP